MKFFRKKSLSRQLFFSSFAIIGFVLAVFSAFSIHLLSESYKREEQTIILDKLAKCVRIADISLGYIDQSAKMLSTNPDLISSVVAPDHSRVERSIAVMNLLGNVTKTNEMVKRAALYVAYDHSIYTSEMTEAHISTDTALNDLMKRYLLSEKPVSDKAVLQCVGNDAYLVEDIPVNGRKRLGTVILKVDKETLYRSVQDYGDGSYIYALDKTGNLFLSDKDMPEEAVSGLLSGQDNRKKQTVSYTSDDSKLTFYNWKDETAEAANGTYRYTPLYIAAMALGLFGIIYSLLTSRAAYRPIRKLVESVSEEDKSRNTLARNVNEIEYLKDLFSRTVADRENMVSAMSVLLPEIEHRLLEDLIHDEGLGDRVQKDLENIHSGFARNGELLVTAMDISTEDEGRANLEEADVIASKISTFVSEQPQNTGTWFCFLPLKNEPWCLVCMKEDGTPENESRTDIEKFFGRLRDQAARNNLRLRAGMASRRGNITLLPGAYREACDTLDHFGNSVPDDGKKLFPLKKEIEEHLDKCTDLVIENRTDDAHRALRLFCTHIEGVQYSTQEMQDVLDLYIQGVTERYTLYGIDRIVMSPKAEYEKDKPAVEQIRSYGTEYITMISNACMKRSGKQVLFIKRYIAEHYQDGDLSMGEIADLMGIKPTYLSTLFTTATGEKLSDFLKQTRIRAARDYLRHTDLPIKEISSLCGYNSVQSFNRVFRQVTGKTPGDYRSEKNYGIHSS